MRQLVWMYEGCEKAAWEHTAALMALVHNVVSKDKVTPGHYNPFSQKKVVCKSNGVKLTSDNIQILKAFTPRKTKQTIKRDK